MHKYVRTLIAILATVVGSVQAADPAVTTSTNDPMVMKIYPDGTKVVVRWSEIGKAVDNGEKHGGFPRMIAYDQKKTRHRTDQSTSRSRHIIPHRHPSPCIICFKLKLSEHRKQRPFN